MKASEMFSFLSEKSIVYVDGNKGTNSYIGMNL